MISIAFNIRVNINEFSQWRLRLKRLITYASALGSSTHGDQKVCAKQCLMFWLSNSLGVSILYLWFLLSKPVEEPQQIEILVNP